MHINKLKVYLRVAESWMHTCVSLFVIFACLCFVAFLALRIGGARIVIATLFTGVSIGLGSFFLSEIIITTIFRAKKPSPEEFPRFYAAVEKICGDLHMWRPRMYIVHMGVPNAFAFGWGFLGQYGVAITEEIYELLNQDELTGVIAHEAGHIRSKDVGLMTVVSLISSSIERLAYLIHKGQTALGATPIAWLFAMILYLISKFVLPLGKAAISQSREYAADALGAMYTGSPEPLKSALHKLSESVSGKDEPRLLGDILFASHPNTEKRIQKLSELTQ